MQRSYSYDWFHRHSWFKCYLLPSSSVSLLPPTCNCGYCSLLSLHKHPSVVTHFPGNIMFGCFWCVVADEASFPCIKAAYVRNARCDLSLHLHGCHFSLVIYCCRYDLFQGRTTQNRAKSSRGLKQCMVLHQSTICFKFWQSKRLSQNSFKETSHSNLFTIYSCVMIMMRWWVNRDTEKYVSSNSISISRQWWWLFHECCSLFITNSTATARLTGEDVTCQYSLLLAPRC